MKRSALIVLAVFSLLTILTAPTKVLAEDTDGLGGKLWFYSYEPPIPLPDPQTSDPNYHGSSSDLWIHESIVESIGFLPSTTVTINEWLGAKNEDSNNTWVVVVINQAGALGIDEIRINGTALPAWTTSTTPPGPLAPHGVFNSAEYYGYAQINVGKIEEGNYICLVISIDLNSNAGPGIKIHLDAYSTGDLGEYTGFAPYSHDKTMWTFIIPEFATGTLGIITSAIIAIRLYRKKHSLKA